MLSRVADNLYWMSRYLERAEHTARLVDVYLNLSLDQSHVMPPAERWAGLAQALYVKLPEGGIRNQYGAVQTLAFDPQNANSIIACVASARENARQVRERISSEMWIQINRMHLDLRRINIDQIWNTQPHEFFHAVKDGAHLFQGITDSTMVHDEGWHFIQLGRHIERAMAISTLVNQHLTTFPLTAAMDADHYFEWLGLLKCFTAFEAYCKVYHADLRPQRIAEFLLFSPSFPHSLRFCIEGLGEALQAVADSTGGSKNSRVHRLAGRLRSALSFDTVEDAMAGGTHEYLDSIYRQCVQIHDALYETYISYTVEAVLN